MSVQCVYLLRHGATEWSENGRHTGRTDIPLTDGGREAAAKLAPALAGHRFAAVYTSPLSRAKETCRLAGLGGGAIEEPGLLEWDYGEYEGVKSDEIHKTVPDWNVFTHGCPGGESPDDVAARVDKVIAKARAVEGDVAMFAHGHLLRTLAARWMGLEPVAGRYMILDTATISILSYEHAVPALKRWNAPV